MPNTHPGQSATERLEQKDRDIETLQRAFVSAATELARAPEVDGSHDQRWHDIKNRLARLHDGLLPEDFDKDQLFAIYTCVLAMRDLLDGGCDLESIDSLLVQSERVRHVLRDALDEHVAGVTGDTSAMTRQLIERMPGVTRTDIGALVDVDRRTLTRWINHNPNPAPPRLRIVARLVAILQHNWTPDGIMMWFERPRRDLDGAAPRELLELERIDEEALISAARAGRSQYAS